MAMLNNQRVYDVIWLWSHKIYMVGTPKMVIFWGWWYDIDSMMMFYTYNQFRGTSIFNPEKPKYHVRRGCLFLHRWDTSQVEVFPTVDVRIGIVEMAQWVFKPIFGSGYPDICVLYMFTWSSWVVSYFICLPTKCHIVFISLYSLYLCCCLPVGVYMDQSLEKKKTRIHWTEFQIAQKSTVNQ